MSLLDLPVEILHRIFDHLDTRTIYRSIRCLCRQLYGTVKTYNRFELNLTSVATCYFESVFDLIHPENIISFIYSVGKESNQTDLLLSIFDTRQFVRLRCLTLLQISKFELDQILEKIISLHLESFSIQFQRMSDYHHKLSLLSTFIERSNLRKLNLTNSSFIMNYLSWPFQCTLEELRIDMCTHDEFRFILEHSPLLKILSIENCLMNNIHRTTCVPFIQVSYPQLISLTMTDCHLSFNEFQLLFSLTPSIRHLKLISYCRDLDIFDGFQWEELIKRNLPLLDNFHFYFRYSFRSNYKRPSLHSILTGFQQPFWINDKRWLVTCDFIINSSSSQIVLYTTPIHIKNFKILIRSQAFPIDDICYFTRSQSNQSDHINEESALVELNFDESDIGSDHILYIACALKHNTTLTTLNLNRNRIGKEGAQYLADILQKNATLTTLDIGGNPIGPEGSQHLADAIQNNTTLTTLCIAGNSIGQANVMHWSNILQKNTTLTTLDLQDNHIGDEGIQHLCDGLRKNITLTTLDLSSNQIEVSGAQYLADLLENNTTLITLSLRDNGINSKGIEYLAYALQTNMILKSLNLRLNHINDDGAEHLANALTMNKTLTTLNLSNNQITGTGSRYLSDALRQNTILQTLDLGRNQIGAMGTKHLSDMLRTNSTLLTLILWDNRIKDRGAQFLASTLSMNITLTTLDIGCNVIGDKGAQHLIEALQHNKTLSTFNLQNNPIVADLILYIDQLIKKNTLSIKSSTL